MLKFVSPWSERVMDAAFVRDTYVNNNRMYLGLRTYDEEANFWEPWCDVTVNIPDETLTDENCAFIDINNNQTIRQFLEENNLAEWTGKFGYSGFCAYPEYRFDMERLAEHLLEG